MNESAFHFISEIENDVVVADLIKRAATSSPGPVKLRCCGPKSTLPTTCTKNKAKAMVHRATAFDTGDFFSVPSDYEVKFMINPKYMTKQRFINHTMRSILVDWLVEVSQEYRLHAQTLFLAVSYVDRFLSVMSVQRSKLQLVGVTALLLASKYEDIYPPDIEDLVYITDNTYCSEQILKMEHLMLKTLKFNMGGVTPYSYFQRFMMLANANDNIRRITLYLMELTLQDGENFLQYLPSTVAASALVVARHIAGCVCWDASLEAALGLRGTILKGCVGSVFNTFAGAANRPQQAVRTKYTNCGLTVVPGAPPPLAALDL